MRAAQTPSSSPRARAMAKLRDGRRIAGLCTECATPTEQPFYLCPGCRDDAAKPHGCSASTMTNMRAPLIADSNVKLKLRANRRILRTLEQALKSARLDNCGIEEEHQEAMRLYLTTWVVGRIQSAIDDMMGKSKSPWAK